MPPLLVNSYARAYMQSETYSLFIHIAQKPSFSIYRMLIRSYHQLSEMLQIPTYLLHRVPLFISFMCSSLYWINKGKSSPMIHGSW